VLEDVVARPVRKSWPLLPDFATVCNFNAVKDSLVK